MMKTLLTLLGLVFFGTSWAADAASFYKQGNELYANGKYQDAVIAYTEALKFTDVAELHYNLGNAYYKTNQLGQAILQYEKALVIQPRFEQASENLSLANSRIVDKIDNTSRKNLSSFWFSLKQEAGVPWFGLMTLSAWLLAAVLFAVFILSRNSALKKAGFFAGSLFLVLSFVLLYLTLSTESDLENNKWAIVTSDKADAFTEPKSGSAITFVIHEGTKVRVTQRNGDWTEIQLANGSTGWVQDGGCTEI